VRRSCGRDGAVWTTDKDGLVPNLARAEITAGPGRTRASHYRALTAEFGAPCYTRVDAAATAEQKARLEKLSRRGGDDTDARRRSRSSPS